MGILMDHIGHVYDVGIIGAGPAGLTATIYCLRDNKNVILFDKKDDYGGQIINSVHVNNIPGFSSISGVDFIQNMMDQISEVPDKNISALIDVEIIDVRQAGNQLYEIIDRGENSYFAKSVIIATGSEYRTLGVEGEKELVGSGISFCTTCDGPFCKDKSVVVIGGGNSALTETLELTKFAKSITILQNLPYLTAEESLCEKVKQDEKIHILYNIKVERFSKAGTQINISTTTTDANSNATDLNILCDKVFMAIGMKANNEFAKNVTALTKDGYIYCSTKPDVYIAGDCLEKDVKQVATACGDGARAAVLACRGLNNK
jgi:thioredoxin reductase (NADPH)